LPAPNPGDPPQIPIHNIVPNDAIAVVVVSPYVVPAYTAATTSSGPGDYPIIVGGCYSNPNYRIVFQNGTLTAIGPPIAGSRPQSEINQKGAKLYPNPASTIVRVQLEHDVQTINDIEIYDEIGKVKTTSSRRISDGFYEINISRLPRGVYVIKAKTAAGMQTFKFIKM
jgi:hypothetical protein